MTTNNLNELQQKAYDSIVFNKKNCFITGCGGVGKSHLIKRIKIDLETKYFIRCDVTSTTGVSAALINGITLHSHLGIKLGNGSYDSLYKMITTNKKLWNRWKSMEVLIIDEASMLDIELFEKIEKLARFLRKCDKPFGGIQIILVADFLQLPAVKSSKFIFESPIWDQVVQETIYLKQIMRQSDPIFQRVLNKVRMGIVDDEVKSILRSREIKYKSKDGIHPMLMYSTNAQVERANKKYYDRLDGEEHTYKISYKWFKNVVYKENYLNNLKLADEVSLKVKAQVMFLTNSYYDKGIFNGSIGIVTKFINGMPLVLFNNGVEILVTPETLDVENVERELIMSFTQLPLKLAYSASIHKLQGSTVSLARIDIKNIFECGQFYVSISRVKELDGLYLRNLNFNLIKANPKAVKFYNNLDASHPTI